MDNNPESEKATSSPVVRVDQDSTTNLDALFNAALQPHSSRPLTIPLNMRKLPKSFFTPPSTGSRTPSVSSISHSRENSGDSVFSTTTTPSSGLQISHSRAHSSPASLQQTYASAQHQHHHSRQRSYDNSSIEEVPLPSGWEQATTPEGRVYYLNHSTKTTQWEDPRLMANSQAFKMDLSPTPSTCNLQQSPQPSLQSSSVELLTASGAVNTAAQLAALVAMTPLPDGWEKATTQDNETYFINHNTRTTTWFDPRIPESLQRAPASGAQAPLCTNNWMQQSLTQSSMQFNPQRQSSMDLRLQSLQLERERLRLRALEITRQDRDMQLRQISTTLASVSEATATPDPFMTMRLTAAEHSRQESADSGLGMGNSYSLPHTPENFLNALDDNMDGISEGGPADLNELSLNDGIDTAEDIVSSLQLGDDFSNEILNDVQSLINSSAKTGNLTWL